MIKAMIFDADGPLYYRTDEVTRQKSALLAEAGYSGSITEFDAAYNVEKFKAYVNEITVNEMFQKIGQAIGLSLREDEWEVIATKFKAIQKQVTPTDDAVTTLKQLKDRGISTCVLTDSFYSESEKWSWFNQIGIEPYLDYVVSSHDIGYLKDSPEAYSVCLDKLGVLVNETMFVGHQQYEMDGAIGITSIAVIPIAPKEIEADYHIESLSELTAIIEPL